MHRYLNWKDPLLDARSVGDVRRVMEQYLKTLGLGDVEALPPSSWEALSVDDIAGSALELTRIELTFMGDAEVKAILQEVAHTYIAASNRIVQIQSSEEPVGQQYQPVADAAVR